MTLQADKKRGKSAGSEKVGALIDALTATGMSKGIARTLAYLTTKTEWATSKEIESATNLRQPEVSIAVRNLVDRGWVERDNLKRESKGRPICIYRMSVDLKDVYTAIEDSERDKISEVEENLSNIRGLWSLT